MPYGPWWRRHRRLVWQHFGSTAITKYHKLQEKSARALLARLLASPDKLVEHVR